MLEQLLGSVHLLATRVLERDLALESGGVVQEPPEGDLLDGPERIGGGRELGDVTDERIVQAQPTLIPQLQDRGRDERLGDRGDPEHGRAVRGPATRSVRIAGAERPREPAATDDAARRRREMVLVEVREHAPTQLGIDRREHLIHDPKRR